MTVSATGGLSSSLPFNSPPTAGGGGPFAVAAAGHSAPPLPTGRPPVLMYQQADEYRLNEYQCLTRKQIELFEASKWLMMELNLIFATSGTSRSVLNFQNTFFAAHSSFLDIQSSLLFPIPSHPNRSRAHFEIYPGSEYSHNAWFRGNSVYPLPRPSAKRSRQRGHLLQQDY